MKLFLTALTALIIFCNSVSSQSISMTVDATKQGKFRAENQRQMPDKIDVLGATMEVTTSGDASGSVRINTGRRQYQPFVIKKLAGAASPQFLQALTSNEILSRVVIEFSGTNPSGEQFANYVITLDDVRVIGFKQSATIPDVSNIKSGVTPSPLMDEIKLVFQRITIESRTGKTMAVDDVSRL